MEIENILIEGNSIGSGSGSIIDGELDISCSDESLVNQVYFLVIYKTDENSNKIEEIGSVKMTYMDVLMAEEVGFSAFDLFDMIDSEKQGVYHYLFDGNEQNEEYVGMNRDVMYIDQIFIKEKYRKKGIGSCIVRELPSLIKNILKLRPGCLVLLANPFEIENEEMIPSRDEKEIERLIEFYEENGLARIEKTQYLVKNMDYR